MQNQPFILGVNYWPRRKAMSWWSDFDAAEVREEFAIIKDIGMTLVRIFLLWEDWQPTPDTVDQAALDNLGQVCDIAAELGLQLDVTFFTGHMSGPSWAPEWMLLRDQPMPPGVRQVVSGGRVDGIGRWHPVIPQQEQPHQPHAHSVDDGELVAHLAGVKVRPPEHGLAARPVVDAEGKGRLG